MYIIQQGDLEVVADDEVTRFCVLGSGKYFGRSGVSYVSTEPDQRLILVRTLTDGCTPFRAYSLVLKLLYLS